jgi:hypothetical protein
MLRSAGGIYRGNLVRIVIDVSISAKIVSGCGNPTQNGITCLEQFELGVVNFPIEIECRLLSNYLYRIRYA